MPRTYKSDPRAKRYRTYDEDQLKEAVEAYQTGKLSYKVVADTYKIDKSVLYRHCTRTMKKHGGQPILSDDTEMHMIKYINICAEWGCPLDTLDLRYIVKSYLDKLGRTVSKFKNNLPGPDFVTSFLKRHKDEISQRYSQNIKKKRAEVSPETIKELEVSIAGIEPCNILNYDETNLTDDPGRKKIITKRGTKYPERVMNSSKASVSLMIAATADGTLLPPYVVYKAQNLYDTWTEQGPKGARYNRTQSGWFDATTFEDWIKTIVLPYFKDKPGKKCLIGDNLSSHISLDIIKMCHAQNISFVFLPANSTHLTQPLDVAFFRPMKIAWRNIVLKWKKTDGKTQATIPKGCFPKLLNKLMEDLHENSKDNIMSGFRKTGIHPIDEEQVLNRLPTEENYETNRNVVEKSVLDLLKEMRYGSIGITVPKRKRKLEIIPGRSVGSTDSEDYIETDEDRQHINKRKITSSLKENSKEVNEKVENKKNKGKGKGKKTKIENGQGNKNETTNLPLNVVENQHTNERESANVTFDATDNFDLIEIGSMPIIFEDLLVCGNEVVIDDRQTNEMKEDKEMSYEGQHIEKRVKNIPKIIADEKLSDNIKLNKVTLNKCKKISPNTCITISKKSSVAIDQPSTSGLQNIPAQRRSSYYRNEDEILQDLMNDDM